MRRRYCPLKKFKNVCEEKITGFLGQVERAVLCSALLHWQISQGSPGAACSCSFASSL